MPEVNGEQSLPGVDWDDLGHIEAPEGGFTDATRGVVAIPGRGDVFVKISNDDMTHEWINREADALMWLSERGFEHAPQLLAHSKERGAIAVEALADADFSRDWSEGKLVAIFDCMESLALLTDEYRQSGGVTGVPPSELVDGWSLVKDKGLEAQYSVLAERMISCDISDDTVPTVEQLLAVAAEAVGFIPEKSALVHQDERSDNFAYMSEGVSKLVDWNWIGLGSLELNKAAVLVDVYSADEPLALDYASDIAPVNFGYLIGFWAYSLLDEPQEPFNPESPNYQRKKFQAHNIVKSMALLHASKQGRS